MVYDLDALMRRKIKPFYGKTWSEGIEFLSDVTTNVGLDKELFLSDRAKIDFAVQYLKGDAAEAWRARCSQPSAQNMTFKEFGEFVQNVHLEMNPSRFTDLACEWNEARQREGQSVHSFYLYLMMLDLEIGSQYTEQQKARHLLAKIKEETRRGIIKYADVPLHTMSQRDIIARATAIERVENERKERELEESKGSHPQGPSSKSKRRRGGKGRARGSSS